MLAPGGETASWVDGSGQPGRHGRGASYSASYSYDALNRQANEPLGGYSYGDSVHPDAATAIGSAWSASYDDGWASAAL